ncbi:MULTISPECIES: FAD-dependent oxidoreductase [unclassified Leptolyngbya]|uniref:NAD(P)/FAD-dependent oxidoreductase n=1 Tax=unclassified Leptolyngbya TaxID=2650499 RepID=UPI0016840763|nr:MULTISPECIES: FAD-dependent oxidoreductase [unclassified Leptolyngbya]MBD1910543.1 FAD-dependent oxidoreductase [Leptolyngbya sp. FACHB-8]MBD2153914.1 FAD-dependent oxidoreductase [Leptolyngbya sp. FACHB-16]
MVSSKPCDIAVVGAGLSGIVCAQQLQRAGYSVVVVEKSRGVGGRLATRRLSGVSADHGTRYLEAQGPYTEELIPILRDRDLVKSWTEAVRHVSATGEIKPPGSEPYYVAPDGMNSVAKFLAEGLTVWRGQRVTALTPTHSNTRWTLTLEPMPGHAILPLRVRGVVLAVPAPQAASLLEPLLADGLPTEMLESVQSVQFDPCITAIAVYPSGTETPDDPAWNALHFDDHPSLGWLSLESRKRNTDGRRVVLLQSNGSFAQKYLEATSLEPIGRALLQEASAFLPGLEKPEALQVHRWRYARVRQGLENCPSAAVPLPIVCAGDWCGGDNLEAALETGEAAAWAINARLKQRSLAPVDFASYANTK